MNKIPIVFTFDKRIILGAAVAIKSLIDCAKADTAYDIYVYHPDIKENTIKAFEKMLEGTNHSITFKFIDKKLFKDAPINKGGSWTEIVYYRLLIPDLLPQYDKVIYADVDVLFKGDLSEAYDINIDDYELGAVAVELNTPNTICHRYFPENKNDKIYISSFIIFNCKLMRESNSTDNFFKTIRDFKDRLKFFDLDVLNITFNKIKSLSFKYGVFQSIIVNSDLTKSQEYSFLKGIYSIEELQKAKEEVIFIHYAGKLGKPWRRRHIPNDYKECMNTIPKELCKFTFKDLRKRLFSKA